MVSGRSPFLVILAKMHSLKMHALLCAITAFCMLGTVSVAQVTAFQLAVAEAAQDDRDIATFYQSNGYKSVWTGASDIEHRRRVALISTLDNAGHHGLPASRYVVDALKEKMRNARDPKSRGAVEVALSKAFLRFARDVQTGVLIPSRIDREIVRQVPYRDRSTYLATFIAASAPKSYLDRLAPQTPEYRALLKEKLRLEEVLAQGGWGPVVTATKLEPGQTGPDVVALRNRLLAKGFLARTNTQVYDSGITQAVQRFQADNGLAVDGVAGPATLGALNKSVEARLQSILVAMERERWFNRDRGTRHVLVNIPDFSTQIIDNGRLVFETKSVVGAQTDDRTTPEFSDVMEFMVINPSWYVPRSIIARVYLPQLQRNPNAASHMEITDRNGRLIDRSAVDFSQYTGRNFPFAMRQPPSRTNALGLVKFMFPNQYSIYLHDTPAKNLFGRDVRAFSHGCVRLEDPFDFAYALLAAQEDDPKAFFQRVLATERETRVNLQEPLPVHIVYRTAFATPQSDIHYRRDVYERDAKIWRALRDAGVVLGGLQG